MNTNPMLTAIDYAAIERRAHRLRNQEMGRVFAAMADRARALLVRQIRLARAAAPAR